MRSKSPKLLQRHPRRQDCRVAPVNYKGWQAQQVSNAWITLIFVPQIGGRLMQVTFDGHPYLFVNERYAGKQLPPSNTQWFNYGGDKLWVLPEGNEDEQHWVGNSDVLDDSPFEFQVRSQGPHCEVVLTGPADPQTGLQFTRTVSLDADSTNIKFHASNKKCQRTSDRMVGAIGVAIRHGGCHGSRAPQ